MVVTETLKTFENDSYDNMALSVIKSTILYVILPQKASVFKSYRNNRNNSGENATDGLQSLHASVFRALNRKKQDLRSS